MKVIEQVIDNMHGTYSLQLQLPCKVVKYDKVSNLYLKIFQLLVLGLVLVVENA